jgi:predicted membrane protein
MMFTLVLEGLEFANIVYKAREGIEVIMKYVMGPLVVPFFVVQFGIGAVTPIAVITYMIWRGTTGKALIVGVTVSAALVLLSVLMMRWNVVIGGQEIAKSGQGLVHYQMHIWGREGLLASIAVVAAPLFLLAGLVQLLPPWQDHAPPPSRVAAQ